MFSLLSPGLFCFFLVPIAECFFAFLTDTLRCAARDGRLGRRVLVDLFGTPHFRLDTVACLRHDGWLRNIKQISSSALEPVFLLG
jgi:hypothetical protein